MDSSKLESKLVAAKLVEFPVVGQNHTKYQKPAKWADHKKSSATSSKFQWIGLDAQSPTLDASEVRDWYHGAPINVLTHILEEGLKPSFGAGGEQLAAHFGCGVPAVYLSSTWHNASFYPQEKTTGLIPTGKKGVEENLPGGTLISLDGTMPLRAVFRCLTRPGYHL